MTRFLPIALLFFLFVCSACGSKEDPVIENEEEVITDVIYQLKPVGGGSEEVTMTFSDPDGDGAEPALVNVTGSLAVNTLYDGTLIVANLSDSSNPQDITAEVINEAADHQFFYIPSAGLETTIRYRDSDGDGNPLGVLTEVETGGFSSGTLKIILRHLPTKGSSATISNPSAAGGETDIEVTFPVSIGN
ncbi:type 1 periplasmic binding fold superfamily protein [Neolewinella litorea]|uniref:Type 1 periplasmic binding fold superfamily protein n=1 Tax=Neolewinella litorea TaxID=2562452 RepID=A0A4S4NRU3_9BACT|nr:type 1 periplasmic binding fold superfamily protein [Neolewinella litorea]THH41945.1 type 1 periplasmic binding fold superfamily protein [Neolewinella litorea]